MDARVSMRSLGLTLAAIALVAAACSPTTTTEARNEAPTTTTTEGTSATMETSGTAPGGEVAVRKGRASSVEYAASYNGGSVLVVSFVGGKAGDISVDPCATDYEVEAIETTDSIEIRVHKLEPVDTSAFPSSYTCHDVGHEWVLDVQLTEPVGDRELVGSDIEQTSIPALEDLWVPTWLPDGWVWESAALRPPNVNARYSTEGERITIWASPVVEAWSEKDEVRRVAGAEELVSVPNGWIVVKPNGANSATFTDAGWEYTIRTPPGTSKATFEEFIAAMSPRRELTDETEVSVGLESPLRDQTGGSPGRTDAPVDLVLGPPR